MPDKELSTYRVLEDKVAELTVEMEQALVNKNISSREYKSLITEFVKDSLGCVIVNPI